MSLNDFTDANAGEPVDLTAAAYLLSAIVNSLGDQIVETAISEVSDCLKLTFSTYVIILLAHLNHTHNIHAPLIKVDFVSGK